MGLDLRHESQEQLEADLDQQWESARERETANRTRFAQRALKPEEVHLGKARRIASWRIA